jgi:hypothetical protein
MEFWLLKLLLASDEALATVAGRLQPAWIQHPMVREIVAQRLALHAAGHWPGFAAFRPFDSGTDRRPVRGSLGGSQDPRSGKQAQDVTLRLRNQFIDRTRVAHAPHQPAGH